MPALFNTTASPCWPRFYRLHGLDARRERLKYFARLMFMPPLLTFQDILQDWRSRSAFISSLRSNMAVIAVRDHCRAAEAFFIIPFEAATMMTTRLLLERCTRRGDLDIYRAGLML